DTVICKTDEDCVNNKGAGFACMMVNREAGFCSDGSEGSRCQCNANDLGCGFLIGILNTNNRGKGYVPCKAGLTCMVSNPQYLSRDAGSIVYGDWYCEKSAQ
ncbi:MAG TPA: hypothetical protein VFQ60_04295, partial [Patescibacteria group bacterium]|nr:hypothetical protein [Patescibacteria group bacterium]